MFTSATGSSPRSMGPAFSLPVAGSSPSHFAVDIRNQSRLTALHKHSRSIPRRFRHRDRRLVNRVRPERPARPAGDPHDDPPLQLHRRVGEKKCGDHVWLAVMIEVRDRRLAGRDIAAHRSILPLRRARRRFPGPMFRNVIPEHRAVFARKRDEHPFALQVQKQIAEAVAIQVRCRLHEMALTGLLQGVIPQKWCRVVQTVKGDCGGESIPDHVARRPIAADQ